MTENYLLLDFLRHGQVTGVPCFNGVSDPPLTDAGWHAMTLAAEKSRRADAVVTSPLGRCAFFARWWGRGAGIPVAEESGFREYDFGLWEGRTAADIMATDPQGLSAFWHDPANHPPPQGESMDHFSNRIALALEKLANTPAVGHLLVITHGGVLRQVAAHVLNRPFQAMWSFDVPLCACLRVLLLRHLSRPPELVFMGMA
ncbi:MAG: alpha-ribazole phosphatase [Magnetococcales bacterium]|nr:alpha-ribazole phosphatase [Magnetococcales bacterium]